MQYNKHLYWEYSPFNFKKVTTENIQGILKNKFENHKILAYVDSIDYFKDPEKIISFDSRNELMAMIEYPCQVLINGKVEIIEIEEGDVIEYKNSLYQLTNVSIYERTTRDNTQIAHYCCNLIDFVEEIQSKEYVEVITNCLYSIMKSVGLELILFEDNYNKKYFIGKNKFAIIEIEEKTKINGFKNPRKRVFNKELNAFDIVIEVLRKFEVNMRVTYKTPPPNIDIILGDEWLLNSIMETYTKSNYFINFNTIENTGTNKVIFNNERYNEDLYLINCEILHKQVYSDGAINEFKHLTNAGGKNE